VQKINHFKLKDLGPILGAFSALGLIFGVGGIGGTLGGIVLLGGICLPYPKIALTGLIFSVALGEFGRIALGSVGFLLTDLLALYTLLGTLPYALKTKPAHYQLWLFGFIGVALLSLLANFPTLELDAVLKAGLYLARFTIYGGLLFTLPIFVETQKIQNYVWKCLFATVLLTAFLGFLQLKFFADFEKLGLDEMGWDPHKGRLTSTWLDPNFVGGYFAFAVAILTSHFLKNPKKQILPAVGIIFLTVALYFTLSRSAYLALAVGLSVVALFQARWLILAGILSLLLILGSGTRASERIWDMGESFLALFGSQTTTLDPTSRLRLENWTEGLEVVAENPILGTGYGTYAEVQWQEGNLTDQDAHSASGADSSLLTVWATTGTLGLIFFLGFLATLATRLWYLRRSPFALGVLAGLGSIFVHSFFVNSLFFTLILAAIVPTLALVAKK